MKEDLIKTLYAKYILNYDSENKDRIWAEHSRKFKEFWYNKIINGNSDLLSDDEIDAIVRILDSNGKGNTKGSESVAKAMVAQGTWRKLFREFASNKILSGVITNIFKEEDLTKKIQYVNELYRMNEGKKNNLTGQSGNVINSMLAAYDPIKNTTMISVKDRINFFDKFEVALTLDFENASAGEKFILTNKLFIETFRSLGIEDSARTLACFCYKDEVLAHWKNNLVIKRENKEVKVSIPDNTESDEDENIDISEEKESIQVQALLAEMGTKMGFSIWLPKSDRGRILKLWQPKNGDSLLTDLPLNYNSPVMKTIENIDVLWLKKRMIVRAFEVEHTTAIYSGILRMADLLALIPNIDIKLHIVAPSYRSEKVLSEIRRPVFSLIDGKPMSQVCTFLSYDFIKELSEDRNLEYLNDLVLDKHAAHADDLED